MKSYPKNKAVRLSPDHWAMLKIECFDRDSYKCRSCGRQYSEYINGLDAHHKVFRSQSGGDVIENLISLCRECHSLLHDGKIPRNL